MVVKSFMLVQFQYHTLGGDGEGIVQNFVERDHLGNSTVDWRVMLK